MCIHGQGVVTIFVKSLDHFHLRPEALRTYAAWKWESRHNLFAAARWLSYTK
jgi:hypothetical protein